MKCWYGVFLIALLASNGWNIRAKEELPRLTSEQPVAATIIYSPKGFLSSDGRATAYTIDQAKLKSLGDQLITFPLKSDTYKKWPEDIAHWRIYVHESNNKVVALDMYGLSLQSPLNGSVIVNLRDPQNEALIKLLKAIIEVKH